MHVPVLYQNLTIWLAILLTHTFLLTFSYCRKIFTHKYEPKFEFRQPGMNIYTDDPCDCETPMRNTVNISESHQSVAGVIDEENDVLKVCLPAEEKWIDHALVFTVLTNFHSRSPFTIKRTRPWDSGVEDTVCVISCPSFSIQFNLFKEKPHTVIRHMHTEHLRFFGGP